MAIRKTRGSFGEIVEIAFATRPSRGGLVSPPTNYKTTSFFLKRRLALRWFGACECRAHEFSPPYPGVRAGSKASRVLRDHASQHQCGQRWWRAAEKSFPRQYQSWSYEQ